MLKQERVQEFCKRLATHDLSGGRSLLSPNLRRNDCGTVVISVYNEVITTVLIYFELFLASVLLIGAALIGITLDKQADDG